MFGGGGRVESIRAMDWKFLLFLLREQVHTNTMMTRAPVTERR